MDLVERVTTEAREHKPAVMLLTLLAAPFFAVGWTVGLIVRSLAFVLSWVYSATIVGFRVARTKSTS